MATKILLKKSSTGGSVPLTGDLDTGEVAINLVDRKIYTNNGSAVVRLDSGYVDSVAPSNPVEGDIWYDTTNNLLKAYNGSAFESAGYATLAALEDVTITSIASGDYIKWDGAEFVNSSLETDVEAMFSAANTGTGYGTLSYSAGEFSFDKVTAADIRGEVSVTDAGGDGSLAYNSATGVFTYTGPSQAEVLAHISGGTGITVDAAGEIALDFTDPGFTTTQVVEGTNLYYTTARANADFDTRLATKTTADLTEGTNLYYTDARARASVSVTDTGGDGSLAYNDATGVITYTGPSATEVRAHFTGGTGVTITDGEVVIGQPVATSDDVTFNKVTTDLIEGGATITIDPAGTGDATGDVIIAGSLTVQGTTTSVNSNEVNIGDSIILLNSDETGTPSQNAGFEVERGTDANKSFIWNEADDAWDLSGETLQNVVLDGGSY